MSTPIPYYSVQAMLDGLQKADAAHAHAAGAQQSLLCRAVARLVPNNVLYAELLLQNATDAERQAAKAAKAIIEQIRDAFGQSVLIRTPVQRLLTAYGVCHAIWCLTEPQEQWRVYTPALGVVEDQPVARRLLRAQVTLHRPEDFYDGGGHYYWPVRCSGSKSGCVIAYLQQGGDLHDDNFGQMFDEGDGRWVSCDSDSWRRQMCDKILTTLKQLD